MNYKTEINGIEVNVDYTNDNIENIFIPILKYAKKLYEEKKKRVLVMLAAPPGAGKSTLLSFFKYLSENNNELMPITTIGMDGFHRYQDYLLTHDMERDGKTYKMVELKAVRRPSTSKNCWKEQRKSQMVRLLDGRNMTDLHTILLRMPPW